MQTLKENLPKVTDHKVFAIAGTTRGTGFVAAQTVGELGGTVTLLNWSSARFDTAVERLREGAPGGTFAPIVCNLKDFHLVCQAAKEISAKCDKSHCLANNAGVNAGPNQATKDGCNAQMQTNHLPHFLLTALLFPSIAAAAKAHSDARIVQNSSPACHDCQLEEKFFGLHGNHLGGDTGNFFVGPMANRHEQSKLANAVFGNALKDKMTANANYQGIRSLWAHPGVSDTGFKDEAGSNRLFLSIGHRIAKQFYMQSKEDGAVGLIQCVMDPSAESGRLYGPKFITGAAAINPPGDNETATMPKPCCCVQVKQLTASP